MRRIAVAALLVSLLAGLASAGNAATTTRLTIPGAGASIAVPSSWEAIDRRTVTNSAAFGRFLDENPALAAFANQMRGANSPIRLMAFDLKLARGFATNLNVVVTAPSPGLTPRQVATIYARGLKAQLRTVRGPVATSVVTLPSGKAVRASYKVDFVNGGQRLTVQTLQYLVLRPTQSLVVTLSTLPSEAPRRSATFVAIARSLRFTP